MAPAIDNPSPPGPASPGGCRSAWWSVGRFGLSVLLISLVFSLLALLLEQVATVPWTEFSWWKIIRRCVSAAAALSLWLCIRKFEGRSLRSYGLPAGGAGKRQLLFGVLLGLGTLGLMAGIGLASGICRIELTPDRLKLWRTVLGFIPAALLVSVLEELIFRGFLLQRLMACSKTLAVIASSALYALVHLKSPSVDAAAARELIGLFLLGGVLAFSYLRTHQLYLAIGLHAVLAYGARINKLVITFQDQSISWLSGTSRLVNGAATWFALLGIGGMVWWWTRPIVQGGGDYGKT